VDVPKRYGLICMGYGGDWRDRERHEPRENHTKIEEGFRKSIPRCVPNVITFSGNRRDVR
jgi:hypothetical protein